MTLRLLVVDDIEASVGPGEPFDVIAPAEVGLTSVELHRRAAMYLPQALVSSLKGVVLRALVAAADEPVVLLDADMLVLGPIDDALALAERHSLVLSPHAPIPLPFPRGAAEIGVEQAFIRAGVFNGGFLAASDAAEPFLAWWVDRCARDCIHDPDKGLILSQAWLALVPALFPHAVLRDRGVNLTPHGFGGDDLEWRAGRPWIGGTPLRLFHFAGGFDAQSASYLGAETGLSWWPSRDDRPGFARLCDAYAQQLRAANHDDAASTSWRFAQLDEAMRNAYRLGLIAAESGGGAEPPNPFIEPEAFTAWLKEPHVAGSPASRYLAALRHLHAYLRIEFPEVPGNDDARLRAWAEAESPTTHPFLGPRSSRRGIRSTVGKLARLARSDVR